MSIKKSIAQNLGIGAVYVATLCDPRRAPELYKLILGLQEQGRKISRDLLEDFHRAAMVRQFTWHNLSPTAGRTALAMRLANDTTYTGIVTRVAIGSGSDTPTVGDTTLQTETYRKAFDDTSSINNVAYLSAFIPAGTATATHNEAGLFIDGTDTADSGQLISRVLFSPPIVKGALTSLTLEATLTIS